MRQATQPKTVGELLDWAWRTHYCRSRSKASRSILEGARTILGPATSVKRIDRLALRRYVDRLRAMGNTDASVARKLAVVMKVLRDAHLEGIVATVPQPTQLAKQARKRVRWLTDDELQRIVDLIAQEGHQDYADLVLFLVDTGCRPSEAFSLAWRDVRQDAIDLWDTKGGGNRTVPLTQRARLLVESRPRDTAGPWATLAHHTLGRIWNRARERGEFTDQDDLVPYALRHTFASRLVQRGVAIEVVQKLMGHSRLEMTMVYAHLAPSALGDAIAKLD